MSQTVTSPARRLLVPTVLVTMVVGGLFLSTFQFTLYDIAQQYGLTSTVMGLLTSVQFAFMILFTIPLGRLSDRVGKKKLYMLQSLCMTVGCLLLWLPSGLGGVVLGVFLGGAGYGMLSLFSTAAVTDAFPDSGGRYVSLACVGFSAGALLGPICTEAMMATGRWGSFFLYIALASLVGLIMVCLTDFYKAGGETPAAGAPAASGGLAQVLRNPVLLMLGAGIVLYLGIETCTASFMDGYFQNTVGGGAMSAFSLSLYWGMMFPSRAFTSAYKGKKYPMVQSCILAAGLALVLVTFLPAAGAKVACFALVGLVLGPVYPVIMGTGSALEPTLTGTVTGFLATCFGVGAGLFPPVIGKLVELLGYHWVMLLMAVLTAALFVVYRMAVTRLRRQGRTQGI